MNLSIQKSLHASLFHSNNEMAAGTKDRFDCFVRQAEERQTIFMIRIQRDFWWT